MVETFSAMLPMLSHLIAFHREEAGQDLLEYALMLGLVAATAVLGSHSLASMIGSALTKLVGKMQNTLASA